MTTWLIELFTTIGLVIHCGCSYCSQIQYSKMYDMAGGSAKRLVGNACVGEIQWVKLPV